MRRPLFSMTAASVLLAGVGLAYGQSSTSTTTWSNGDGSVMREYSTTRHYDSFSDPGWRPSVGAELPSNATIYPLPDSIHVPGAERYSYGIINNSPVVVERTTRKVVHTWN